MITRIVLVAVGIGLGVIGLLELIDALAGPADWFSFGKWFLIPPILSDAVIMPAVAVVGWLVLRLPFAARGPAVVGGVISVALLFVGAPFLTRPGLRLDNPTLLDRDYPTGFLVYLVILWAAMLGWWLVRRRGHQPAPSVPVTEGSPLRGQ
ncbi:hypothetical protein ABLG96_03650 [Nakamurella sp. A5-74]|uniref:Uncharacterized protein n=1 Tax=Nakamurella sp. A5-74 TaxID=3158264 RepID=A0AAU8DR05_9ACTN